MVKLKPWQQLVTLIGLGGLSSYVYAADGGSNKYQFLTFSIFGFIICLTMAVTYWAAKKTRSAADYYAAGGGISGVQNGWAIAGDFLSAASFLGYAGLISLFGFDGYFYSVSSLITYIAVLLLIAEPCRNIGKYTLGDILSFRNDPKKTKTTAAISSVIVSTCYLTAQMVGGAVLVKTLVGIEYEVSVITVGTLMLGYVLFGGMLATTWVQIIKAVLLISASIILVILVWAPYGFSFPGFLDAVVKDPEIQRQVARLLADKATNMTAEELGQRFLEPGLLLKNPLDMFSLGLALVLGTAGLPHILMRFFTVPTAKDARTSVIWAMGIIGGFYLITIFLGMGAALNVGPDKIIAADKGGNMAAPLLAQYLGGGPDSLLGNFMLAFVAAVAFATIVAVVAGLVLAAASAIAHDIYVGVIREGKATPEEQVKVARIATLLVGAVAIASGILAKGQNVAHLVILTFAIAASANFPAVLLTLYWKRCNTGGVIAGIATGIITTMVLVLISPNMTYPNTVRAGAEKTIKASTAKLDKLNTQLATADEAGKAKITKDIEKVKKDVAKAEKDIKSVEGQTTSIIGLEKPIIDFKNPGIVSIPLGFLAVFLGSILYGRDERAESMWDELYVRQNTGILVSDTSSH